MYNTCSKTSICKNFITNNYRNHQITFIILPNLQWGTESISAIYRFNKRTIISYPFNRNNSKKKMKRVSNCYFLPKIHINFFFLILFLRTFHIAMFKNFFNIPYKLFRIWQFLFSQKIIYLFLSEMTKKKMGRKKNEGGGERKRQ